MSKYSEFHERYKSSGLSQKSFAELEGISPSMVSYYINRAKREQMEDLGSFGSIEVVSNRSTNRCVEITTSSGMKISIPL